ncbi:hypothetical protein BDZ91DRAFT_768160 [Kalaharituber pfeilii]|nr:hypothetical protein BDZ91DRAFT_768160 [Kalaharituber pfeilii]
MGHPNYTWENCHNVTAVPDIDPVAWRGMLDIMAANGNTEFDASFLPPKFCDPENYVSPDRGPSTLIFTMVSLGLTSVVVLGRFLTRTFVAGRIGWDDWTILMATAILVGEAALTVYDGLEVARGFVYLTKGIVRGGIGQHVYDLNLPMITTSLKVMFWHILIYSFNIFMVKASLLFFYKRLFPANWTRMQKFLTAFIIVEFLYAIASCMTFTFHCSPVASFWRVADRLDGCPLLNTSVKIPLEAEVTIKTKTGVGMALVAAMLRLGWHPETLRSMDVTWNFTLVAFCAQLEHSLAIITASIPALTALFRSARIPKESTNVTMMSPQHRRYLSADSFELNDTTTNCSELPKAATNPSTVAREPNPVMDDFLSWAYDPERKNGRYANGNYANAYGEYTNNIQTKTKKIRNFCHRVVRSRDLKDEVHAAVGRAPGNGGVESNENLVGAQLGYGANASGRRVGREGIHEGGDGFNSIEAINNQIMMTNVVEVKVTSAQY